MNLLGATYGIALISALLPFVNIELYLAAVAAETSSQGALALAIASAAGQTTGKILWYVGARRATDSRWMQRRMAHEKRRASYDRWMARAENRPRMTVLIIFLAASLGLPPLLVTSVIAGSLKVNPWVFVPATFVGRCLRFYCVVAGVDLALA